MGSPDEMADQRWVGYEKSPRLSARDFDRSELWELEVGVNGELHCGKFRYALDFVIFGRVGDNHFGEFLVLLCGEGFALELHKCRESNGVEGRAQNDGVHLVVVFVVFHANDCGNIAAGVGRIDDYGSCVFHNDKCFILNSMTKVVIIYEKSKCFVHYFQKSFIDGKEELRQVTACNNCLAIITGWRTSVGLGDIAWCEDKLEPKISPSRHGPKKIIAEQLFTGGRRPLLVGQKNLELSFIFCNFVVSK